MKHVDIQLHLASTDFYSFYIWDEEVNAQLINNYRSLKIKNLQHIRIPVSVSSFDDQNHALQSLKQIMAEINKFTLSINAAFFAKNITLINILNIQISTKRALITFILNL